MPGNPNLSTEVDRWLSGDSLVAAWCTSNKLHCALTTPSGCYQRGVESLNVIAKRVPLTGSFNRNLKLLEKG